MSARRRWRRCSAATNRSRSSLATRRALRRRVRRAPRSLNPPADTTADTDAVEKRTVARILAALEGSELEKVVVESTGGAQPGRRIGDLGVLWEFEEGLRRQSIPAAINRAAYYMSNWDGLLACVSRTGELPTMFPADLEIPMVAPRDLGEVAGERLLSSLDDTGIRYVEGPRRYSAADVARAFAQALDRPVQLVVTPREKWKEAYLGLASPKLLRNPIRG